MATCTLHFYSLEGERRLSVQTWTLIPSYGGKAGFPLSGLVPVLSCFHTAFQSTQSLHFTTSRKHKMSHQESNRKVPPLAQHVCPQLSIPHGFLSSLPSRACLLLPHALQESTPSSNLKLLLGVQQSLKKSYCFGFFSLQKTKTKTNKNYAYRW